MALALDAGLPSPGGAAGESAREFVERFAAAEFEGDEDRFERIRLSPDREKATRDLDPTDTPKVFEATWSPFVAVRSFEIVEVESTGRTGRARIRYECLARSPGKAVVHSEPSSACFADLRLVREGESWFALDPPAVHVSIDRLVQAYREAMKRFTADWAAQATEVQIRERKRVEEGLRALEQIAAAGPAR